MKKLPTVDKDKIERFNKNSWTTRQMIGHYWLGGVLGFIIGVMVTIYVLDYNNLLK